MAGVYLTIDDGPSSSALEKLDFFAERGITAIWFLLGENIAKNKEAAIEAIRGGHILGNHSYSHPHFGVTSTKTIREEITKTELLLEEVYASAGARRPAKLFRFPYGETGGFFKKRALYKMLEDFGFEGGPFSTVQYGILFQNKTTDRHWMWSYDVREWALAKEDLRKLTFAQVLKKLRDFLESFSRDKDQIILMHDHVETHEDFCRLIDTFLEAEIIFSPVTELLSAKGGPES